MNEELKLLADQAIKDSGKLLYPAIVVEGETGDIFRIPQAILERFAESVRQATIDQITVVRSANEIVAVTLTDEEHRILKVVWEKS